MIKETKELKAAVSRLQSNHDFKLVTKWFAESLEEQKDINIDLRGEEVARGQGKAEVLRDIVTEITNQ